MAARRGFGCGSFSRTKMRPSRRSTFQQSTGTQGRRAECLAAAQIEAGMVPRAAHRAVNNEAVGERPMIVGAMRADREDVRAAQDQQHLVVADMSKEVSNGQVGQRDALGQIGAARSRLFSHCRPPSLSDRTKTTPRYRVVA